jgi:PAS domain S-box-containing protein
VNGLSVYFKDITDRKRTDEAVRASEQVRMLIMDSAMDAIICMNTEGVITVWNPQAERTFGWTEKEMVGKLLSETIVPLHLRDGQKRGLNKYLLSGYGPLLRKPFETTSLDSQGNEFPVEVSVIPIKQKDSEFFCAFVRDISERKKAEANLNILHQNLLEQSTKLQISNEELEKYAYVTSHDLQEPLRMVSSFLQLLQKKYESQLDDTAQKYINFAVDGAERMKTLILDLLEFSRISSEQVEHTTISLNEVVNKTLLSLKASIDETQATIIVPSLPEVSGNEFQLLQLFQNLLSNAIKYKGEADPVIEIGFTDTELYWQFSIKDNGLGIDPKYFEKIFIIFQRLHNKKDFKGTGIGLTICKKIVELHHGRIWVESSGTGSIFHFNLKKKLNENKFLEKL